MTPEPAGQARARIRNEALRLFAEHGEQRVSMRQIATSAGVAVGSIQHHFGTRDGLVQAVDERVIDHFADADQADESRTPAAVIAGRDEAVQRMLQVNPTLVNDLRREALDSASGGRLLQRLTALVQREVQRARASGMASTTRRESTQVIQVLVRQIGSLTLQPLVDAPWRQVESDPTAIKPHLRVSISMDDGSSSAAVAPETAGSDTT